MVAPLIPSTQEAKVYIGSSRTAWATQRNCLKENDFRDAISDLTQNENSKTSREFWRDHFQKR